MKSVCGDGSRQLLIRSQSETGSPKFVGDQLPGPRACDLYLRLRYPSTPRVGNPEKQFTAADAWPLWAGGRVISDMKSVGPLRGNGDILNGYLVTPPPTSNHDRYRVKAEIAESRLGIPQPKVCFASASLNHRYWRIECPPSGRTDMYNKRALLLPRKDSLSLRKIAMLVDAVVP